MFDDGVLSTVTPHYRLFDVLNLYMGSHSAYCLPSVDIHDYYPLQYKVLYFPNIKRQLYLL